MFVLYGMYKLIIINRATLIWLILVNSERLLQHIPIIYVYNSFVGEFKIQNRTS